MPKVALHHGPTYVMFLDSDTIWYDRTSQLVDLNEARKDLFIKRGKHRNENLPPTKVALAEHTRRAAYQSGQVWGQAIDQR